MYLTGIILFSLLFSVGHSNASSKHERYETTCKINYEDLYGKGSREEEIDLKKNINDTFRGEIVKIKTENVLKIKFFVDYLNATFEDQTITISTSDRFNNYERESYKAKYPIISVKMDMYCTEDGRTTKHIIQPVTDINNHNPEFNQKSYYYGFGMDIPKDLKLTDITPIKISDIDVSNKKIILEMEPNEYFGLHGYNLTTLKEIKAPFNKTFIIKATDEGIPPKSTEVPVTVAIKNSQEFETEIVTKGSSDQQHPPVFSQHIYFADYTRTNRLDSERIIIKMGADKRTYLKQKGYELYFNAEFKHSDHKEVVFKKIRDLPKEIIDHLDVLVIEIEAINEGLHVPGRTALLIRLPKLEDISFDRNGNGGSAEVIFGYKVNGLVVPFLLFAVAVSSIIFINAYFIILFIKKQKQNPNI